MIPYGKIWSNDVRAKTKFVLSTILPTLPPCRSSIVYAYSSDLIGEFVVCISAHGRVHGHYSMEQNRKFIVPTPTRLYKLDPS